MSDWWQPITQTIAESDALCVRFHVEEGRETPLQSCDPQLRPALQQVDLRGVADPLQEARSRMEADVAANSSRIGVNAPV